MSHSRYLQTLPVSLVVAFAGTLLACSSSPSGTGTPDAASTCTAMSAAPSVTITAPNDQTEVSASVTSSATVAGDCPVTSVVFSVDQGVVATLTAAPFQAAWDTTTAAEGQHQLRWTAQDSLGRTGSASVTVTVNNCDLDDDGELAMTCGGSDCNDNAPDVGKCGGGMPACSNGACICSGQGATDTCIAARVGYCSAGVCRWCTADEQCGEGLACNRGVCEGACTTCGNGFYCPTTAPRVCQACGVSDPNHCGDSSAPDGCYQCSGDTPDCRNGRCVCNTDASCGTGRYCDGGEVCASCSLTDAMHCGTPDSTAGCSVCSGGASACVDGACQCTGSGATDSCTPVDGRVCVGGACAACTASSQCGAAGCCLEETGRCGSPWNGSWRTVVPGATTPDVGFSTFDSAQHRLILIDPQTMAVWTLSVAANGHSTWTNITPAGTAPPLRDNTTLVYDATNARAILFGGGTGNKFDNDVWALSLPATGASTWTQLTPSGTGPAPRSGHVAVYDAASHRMVVFGGNVLVPNSNPAWSGETWALSLPASGTPAWTALSPTGTAPVATQESAVYNPLDQQLIFFGGIAGNGGRSNDTWTLSLPSSGTPVWTKLAPTGTLPSARESQMAVFDTDNRQLVVFGGETCASTCTRPNEAWSLSFPTSGTPAWSQLTTSTPVPPGRVLGAAAYDPVNRWMILYGGDSKPHSNPDPRLDDVWTLQLSMSPASWTQLGPTGAAPFERRSQTAINDTGNSQLVLFDGLTGLLQGDLWTLPLGPGASGVWTRVVIPGDVPSGRYGHSAIYDAANQRMIVFGGADLLNSGRYNEVWSLSLPVGGTPSWTKLSPSGTGPSAREGHTAVYDAANQRMIVFGGTSTVNGTDVAQSDVWSLSLPATGDPVWTQLTPSGATPGKRADHAAFVDTNGQRMIIVGGTIGGADVWALSLSGAPVWTQLLKTGAGPSANRGVAVAFDEPNQAAAVYGGNAAGFNTNELWSLLLPAGGAASWKRITATGTSPGDLAYVPAVFDDAAGEMILCGTLSVGGTTSVTTGTFALRVGRCL